MLPAGPRTLICDLEQGDPQCRGSLLAQLQLPTALSPGEIYSKTPP